MIFNILNICFLTSDYKTQDHVCDPTETPHRVQDSNLGEVHDQGRELEQVFPHKVLHFREEAADGGRVQHHLPQVHVP